MPTWASDFDLFIEELEANFRTYDPVGEAEAELEGLHMQENHQAMKYFIKFTQLAACVQWGLVLGKFGPRPIGTRTGLDQTQQSWSQSGIFPKTWDHLVSSLGNSILPEMVPDPVWTGTAYINYLSNVFNIIFLRQLLFYKLLCN